MLKNKFPFLLLALVLSLAACEETKFDVTPYSGDNFYRFPVTSNTIFEDDLEPTEIAVLYSVTDRSNGSVDFQITGGTEGVDYELLNSGSSLSFDVAGGYQDKIRIQPLLNPNTDSDIVLEITLTNPQSGVAGFPGPEGNSAVFRLTIQNACAPVAVGGDYNSVTTGQSTDGCCPDQVANFEGAVSVTDNGDGTYTVSDFSAGLYLEWYDVYGITPDFPLPATLTVSGATVTVSGSEPFGTSITGSGTYDKCTGTIIYTWANGYADTGTVTLNVQ